MIVEVIYVAGAAEASAKIQVQAPYPVQAPTLVLAQVLAQLDADPDAVIVKSLCRIDAQALDYDLAQARALAKTAKANAKPRA